MPRSFNERLTDGPIPGENWTSDTRNYPWHRPPQYDDLNDACEAFIAELTEEETVYKLIAAAELGFDVRQLTSIWIMRWVMEGKITIDYGIILAGPVARTIEIVFKATDTEYEMGLRKLGQGIPTRTMIRELKKSLSDAEVAAESMPEMEGMRPSEPSFMDMEPA